MSSAQLGALSTMGIYAAMAAYAVAFVAFSIDLSALTDGGPGERRRRAAGIGMATMWLGAVFHVLGLLARGLAAGRVPWANLYEFTIVFSFVAVVVFLVLSRRRDVRYLGAFIAGPALLALGLAVTVFFVVADGVKPALQSYWLIIHVSVATISVGVLSVAAALSVLQLARAGGERGAGVDGGGGAEVAVVGSEAGAEPVGSPGGEPGGVAVGASATATVVVARPAPTGAGRLRALYARVIEALPPVEELERLAYRLNAIGFVLWTFTLIAGAIWAEHAWARYWGWDAKEVWTFVIWVVYAGYLHARATRGWSGRRAAYFALTGYVCILLNYFVVNFTFTSLHTYTGM